MIVTAKLMTDARALVKALEHAADANGVMTAMGVTEIGRSFPANVNIFGGTGVFATTSINKWATAFNEVIVYEQARLLARNVHGSFSMPDVGPKALVSYTGSVVAAPVNPVDDAVYRLEVDSTTATTLAWKPRPGGGTLPNSIMTPTRIAIGTFSTPPTALDHPPFEDTNSFFAWLLTKTVWEPMTVIFSTQDNHEMRYPTDSSSYTTEMGTPYQNQLMGAPHDFRRIFRGHGRLIFSAATQNGVESPTATMNFAHLAMKGVDITVIRPATGSRLMGNDNPWWHYAVWLDRCHLTLAAPFTVAQAGDPDAAPMRIDDTIYSVRLHRCKLSQTVPATTAYFALSTSDATTFNWGLIQSCEIDGMVLAGYNTDRAIPNTQYFPPTSNEAYRDTYNLTGWRVVNTTGHSANPMYADSVYETPGSSNYLRPPMNYTFVNCELWYGGSLVLGSTQPGTSVNLNMVHSDIRVAGPISVRDMALAPALVKLTGSTLLGNELHLEYLTSQQNLQNTSAQNVQREALNIPGYIWLEDSSFGVADATAAAPSTLTGDATVKAVIYAAANSNVYLPAAMTYTGSLVVLESDGTVNQLLSSTII